MVRREYKKGEMRKEGRAKENRKKKRKMTKERLKIDEKCEYNTNGKKETQE